MKDPGHIEDLLEKLRAGDRGALGRAITLVESTRSEEFRMAQQLIERCLPFSGRSLRVGITGMPGAGKSTLIDMIGMRWINAGHRVAVLAIDPSSERSGGSILGDKTRMLHLSANERAFIRPSPTGGVLGGIGRRTHETVILCEAAGYDRVMVETVGVGQNESMVEHLVDVCVLLVLAGAGDDLQGIKRGIMEAADVIAITKADGDNVGRSEQARLDLRSAIALLPPRDHGHRPEVLRCSAVEDLGVDELLNAITARAEADRKSGYQARHRDDQEQRWLRNTIRSMLLDRFHEDPAIVAAWPSLEKAVLEGRLSPFQAADQLMALFRTTS